MLRNFPIGFGTSHSVLCSMDFCSFICRFMSIVELCKLMIVSVVSDNALLFISSSFIFHFPTKASACFMSWNKHDGIETLTQCAE